MNVISFTLIFNNPILYMIYNSITRMIISQESKGIRQWSINLFTMYIPIEATQHYPFSLDLDYWLARFNTHINKPTNQNPKSC